MGGERDRERETDTETDTETQRQTDRDRDRETERDTERQRHRHTHTETDRQADRQTDRQTERRGILPQSTFFFFFFLNRKLAEVLAAGNCSSHNASLTSTLSITHWTLSVSITKKRRRKRLYTRKSIPCGLSLVISANQIS